MLISQADHPLFMWQLLLLKSEYWSLVFNRQNKDEYYRGYNLLQNTDLELNVQEKFKRNVILVNFHVFPLSGAV